jgi:hypothetical protein
MNKKIKIIAILLTLCFLGFDLKISQAVLFEGSLAKTKDSAKIYVITKGQKHWIPNEAAFNSYPGYRWKDIQIVDQAILNQYPRAKHVKLANDPKVYYITESGLKRHLLNPDVFLSYGNQWEDIIEISQTELNAYEDCQFIQMGGDYKVYKIEDGQKRWIKTAEVFNQLGYDWSKICPVNQTEFHAYFTGGPIISAEPEQNTYPETFILEGPTEGAVLETTEVTFKYSGTNPLGDIKELTFETYLEGYDQSWDDRGSNDSQTFNLSEETRAYTFYVRAKNEQGYVDPTPASRTFQIGVSPYYQQVEIKKVYPAEEDFQNDYLILQNNADESINISGWILENKLTTITIPQAVNKLRYPFSIDGYSDITLPQGGEVVISMDLSPLGINFRLNKCTGYLDQSDQFCPSLPKECPEIEESEYSHLKKTCRDFIDDLGRCEIPNYSDKWEISVDNDCTDFLNERFNYKYCFEKHYLEIGFLKDEWRVFLSKSIDVLNNDSGKLILRDKNGLLVDEYSY